MDEERTRAPSLVVIAWNIYLFIEFTVKERHTGPLGLQSVSNWREEFINQNIGLDPNSKSNNSLQECSTWM